MAFPQATEHWQEIKSLAEQGVEVSALSEKFGVKEKTIYDRSAREDWQTPLRVKTKFKALSDKAGKDRSNPLFGGLTPSEFSDSVLLETWETRASDLRNLAYGVAVQAIRESKGQIVIESASDLKHAVHVARQATGLLDTDAPQIQLSLFGNGDIAGPPIMEAMECGGEALQELPESADFWD